MKNCCYLHHHLGRPGFEADLRKGFGTGAEVSRIDSASTVVRLKHLYWTDNSKYSCCLRQQWQQQQRRETAGV